MMRFGEARVDEIPADMAEKQGDAVRAAVEGLWNADDDAAYLVGGRCSECSGVALGIRTLCPHCHAEDTMTEVRIGQRGTLYSATVVHQGPAEFEAPYRVGYVDVGDGVRIFAHIELGDDAPAIGDQVELTVRPVKTDSDGDPLSGPFYRRAG